MKELFFYGLFMDEEILRGLDCNPVNPRIVILEGYGLRIGEKATLVKSEQEYCYGQLITLPKAEIEALYSPQNLQDYYPLKVEVKDLTGKCTPTSTYILPESKLSGSNCEYAKKLHLSASRLGFPDTYLKIIQSYIG